LQLLKKSLAAQRDFPREGNLMNFESRAGTNLPRFQWLLRNAQKLCGKNAFDGLKFPGRIQQPRGPLRKNAGNSIMIFLVDEIVEGRIRLREQGIQGSSGPIVGVKMKWRCDALSA
jgi:hypothetical protein